MSHDTEVKKMEAELLFKEKNMLVGYLLWLFLAGFGAHRFYLGRMKSAIGMIVLFFAGILTGGVLLIPFYLWVLADAYFVYKFTTEHNDEMKMKQMDYLKSE